MRNLDTFILDEMIEQYRRFNPMPDFNDGRPELHDQLEAQLMVTLLQELQALRVRSSLYETRIVHLNQELSKSDRKISFLKSCARSGEQFTEETLEKI